MRRCGPPPRRQGSHGPSAAASADRAPRGRGPAAVTPAEARRRRAVRDRRILDALRLGGSAEVIAAALGISPHLVRRIAFEARKNNQPGAVPPRKPYRRGGHPQQLRGSRARRGP